MTKKQRDTSMKNSTQDIIDFLIENKADLVEIVAYDLKMKKLDCYESVVVDTMTDTIYKVSMDKIVNATISRVVKAIKTFK
jgi:hypothetical protein